MYGITHVFHAALGTQVVATNHIAGIALHAWYVFEVQPDPSDLPLEAVGPITDEHEAVEKARAIYRDLADLEEAIKGGPSSDLGV